MNIKSFSYLLGLASKGEMLFKRSNLRKNKYRRSIYYVENLFKGQEIKKHHIRRIRPGNGLAPKYFNEIIGQKVNRNVERGEPVAWVDIE